MSRPLPMATRAELCAFARIVETAVFQCVQNAARGNEAKWRAQADKLETKFTTDYGRHYSHFTGESA